MITLFFVAVSQLLVLNRLIRRSQYDLLSLFFASGFFTYSLPLFISQFDTFAPVVSSKIFETASLLLLIFYFMNRVGFKFIEKLLGVRPLKKDLLGFAESPNKFLMATTGVLAGLFLFLPNHLKPSVPIYLTLLNWVAIYFLYQVTHSHQGKFIVYSFLLLFPIVYFLQTASLYAYICFASLFLVFSFIRSSIKPIYLLIPLLISGVFLSNVRYFYRQALRKENVKAATFTDKTRITAWLLRDSLKPNSPEASYRLLPSNTSNPQKVKEIAAATIGNSETALGVPVESKSQFSKISVFLSNISPKAIDFLHVPMALICRLATRYSDGSLNRVVEWVPHKTAFWKGRSYSDLFWRLIPRVFRPPDSLYVPWNEYGRTLQYIESFDNQTSVSFSLFAEAYLNFGLLGIITVGFLMGTLFAFLQALLVTKEKAVFLFARPILLFHIISILSPFTSWVQILFQNFAVVFLVSGVLQFGDWIYSLVTSKNNAVLGT